MTHSTEHDFRADIKQYRIGPEPTLFPSTCFITKSFYLSPICAVLHLSPNFSLNQEGVGANKTAQDNVKEDLFRLLRKWNQLILSHGAVYPLAGVLETPNESMAKMMRSWGGDQEWHRGGFTLFVEEDKPYKRLADLLLPPRSDLISPPPEGETRTLTWFREKMTKDDKREEMTKDDKLEETAKSLHVRCNKIFMELEDLPTPVDLGNDEMSATRSSIQQIVSSNLNAWYQQVSKQASDCVKDLP
ncbi:MAG: hypothetical protein H7831_12290 [Magnetococcus sp. WYHC-3]